MSQNPEMPLPVNATPNLTTCTNCHSPMPSELRFCRNCGFRLGEGLAEYTETVRFGSERGPLVPGTVSAPMPKKKKRRMSGMAWVFVGLLIFFIGAAAFTAIISPIREHVPVVHVNLKKSYTGVDNWENPEQGPGVTFDSVSVPGGPADKAGLVGGDVIVNFDGQPVQNEDEMSDLMARTPEGKTVEVIYLRDGEQHKTQLTTVSESELERLQELFSDRPEGRATFGYSTGEAKRVEIPGTKMFGVQLDELTPSRAADIAGVKKGDIVIAVDDVPIRTTDEFLMRVRRALPYSTIKLGVMRNGEKLDIPVKLGGN
ncbi:MAG TPA: PDZ domain-containing protein [Pyrinomonadaceae bacterium]|nr:PDZ domain-containing protein [Pyrinomonadaceae bacterium]